MEVQGVVRSRRELEARNQTSVLVELVSPVVGRHVGAVSAVLTGPSAAPVTTSVSVVKLVVGATSHVVNNGIGVDADVVRSASLDHAAELVTGATTTVQVV